MINPYGQKKRHLAADAEKEEENEIEWSKPLADANTNLMPTLVVDHAHVHQDKFPVGADDQGDGDSCYSSSEEGDQDLNMSLVDDDHGRHNTNRSEATTTTPKSNAFLRRPLHHPYHHYPTTTATMSETASEQASALVIAASDKAGMDQLDRTRIDVIILRESGNSLFIQQQKRRDEKVNQRIELMKRKLYEHEEDSVRLLKKKRANHNHNNIDDRYDWRRTIESQLDAETNLLLQQRRSHSTMVVVDMDMFYMACELLTRPDLHDKPACVGTGMILTSNYCARKYGVRSAMAGWIGDKLVEELSNGQERLHHVPAHFALYKEKSNQVKAALSEYDPRLRSYSLDEAYLDIGPYLVLQLTKGWSHDQIKAALSSSLATAASTPAPKTNEATKEGRPTGDAVDDTMKSDDEELVGNDSVDQQHHLVDCCIESLLGPHSSSKVEEILNTFPPGTCLECATQILSELRQKVFDATQGLTCSAGLAPNVMLAKMASDLNKPNGQLIVGPTQANVLEFLHPLPARKVPGIGRVTEKMLRAFDIVTVQDLFQQRALVKFLFQPATARFLWLASLGCSGSEAVNEGAFAFGDSTCELEDHQEVDATNDDGTANGIQSGSTAVTKSSSQKGISRERTFASGRPWSEVNARLEDIARGLSADMKRKNLWAHTITVKAKLHTFDMLSRSRTMADHVLLQDPVDMVRLAVEMLRELKAERKGQSFSVRLLGVRCSNFATERERSLAATASTMKQSNLEQFSLSRPQDDITATPLAGSSARSTSPKRHADDDSIIIKPPSKLQGNKTKQRHDIGSIFQRIAQQSSKEDGGSTTHTIATARKHAASTDHNELDVVLLPESPTVPCPVCGTLLFVDDNERLNRHLDSCLNGPVVRNAVRESRQTQHGTSNNLAVAAAAKPTAKAHPQRRAIADFFR